MRQVFIGNGRARLPESLDDSGNLERVPYQDGVRYHAQAARLVHDLLVIPSAKFTLAPQPLIKRLPIASRRPSMLPQPAIIIVSVIPRFEPNTHGTMVVPGSSARLG